jgi:uncharacterized protein YqfA (UPF0365 family)
MNNNHIILIIFLILFFSTLLLIVKYLPVLFAKLRTTYFGLNLTFKQCEHLMKNFALKKDFLIATKEILNLIEVPIEEITSHYLAGGNMNNLTIGLKEMKTRNQKINFKTLSTLDLAGKDLIIEINKAEKNNWIFKLTD